MFRKLLGAASLAVLVTTAPVFAQQQAPDAGIETQLVGLPVYSSDGQKLGEVTNVASMQGRQILRANMDAFLGFGSKQVLIPADMFEHKVDRIEVSMSAAQVRDTITKQKDQERQ